MQAMPGQPRWRKTWLPEDPTRSEVMRAIIWPLLALIVIASLWVSTWGRIDEDYRHATDSAHRQALALANAYAEQVRRSIRQIDQISLELKFEQQYLDQAMDLGTKRDLGVYPESEGLYVAVTDRNGIVRNSSLATIAGADIAYNEFFQLHKKSCCEGLLIAAPTMSRSLQRPMIRFSRRIDNPDGSFKGVAIVSVQPANLLTVQSEAFGSASDFVSVRATSGALLVAKTGDSPGGVESFYVEPPRLVRDSGTRLEAGSNFRDGQARIVGWRKLGNYPLVTVAALSESAAMSHARLLERERLQMMSVASGLFALAGLAGALLAFRLIARERREDEIRKTYRVATDEAHEGFYMIRPLYDSDGELSDFQLEDCNQWGARILGSRREDLIGIRVSSLESERYRRDIHHMCAQALQRGVYEDEIRVGRPSRIAAAWLYRRMVRTGGGLALTLRDISNLKAHEEALSNMANHDALTGLPNRRWLADFLPQAIARREQSPHGLALLFIDLDNFKNVNDTLGHDTGDELLVEAARRLKSVVRGSDPVVRLGGDEFTVVLEQIENRDDVDRVARHLLSALGASYQLAAGSTNQVSASIGISLYPEDGRDPETLLKHADIAMYAAKAAGKSRRQFYQSQLSDSLLLRLNREQALRQAVEQNQFLLHYQPRVDTRSGELISMEALVRWQHPERGLVYPSDFIDVMEDIGLILPLGEIVIAQVCEQLAQWRREGVELLPVSVNVSPRQLKESSVSQYLARQLELHRLSPHLVEVELTESAVIDSSRHVMDELAELRRMGVKLMIDDFGTGYSSLAQLHSLDVDMLKVDRAFTRALGQNAEGQVVFRAIMSMARALGIDVVAEGVETRQQLTMLQKLTCDQIQGYLVSMAVAPVEMGAMLLRRALLPRELIQT